MAAANEGNRQGLTLVHFSAQREQFLRDVSGDTVTQTAQIELKSGRVEAPDDRLLEFRGNAGTHDMRLGVDTLQALRRVNGGGGGWVDSHGVALHPFLRTGESYGDAREGSGTLCVRGQDRTERDA